MRDPERIEEMIRLIKELWLRGPDLRFNQLLYNLQYEFSQLNDGAGQIKEIEADGFTRTGFDLFNIEDNKFMEFLESKVAE